MIFFPKRSCPHCRSTQEDEYDETGVEPCPGFGCLTLHVSNSLEVTSCSELFNLEKTSPKYNTFLCE
jgi:hypothetical protein